MLKRSKRMGVLVALVAGLTVVAFAGESVYLPGSTCNDVVFSSSTVPFSVQEISVGCDGSYVEIVSSYTVSATNKLVAKPSLPVTIRFSPAVSMKGTGKRFKLLLQANTTAYYVITGVRE